MALAAIIDGKLAAAAILGRIARVVSGLPFQPGLAVVLIGDNPASAVYVRTKDRAAQQAGVSVQTVRLPAHTSQTDAIAAVGRLSADPAIDGVLVQLPLPDHLDASAVLAAIDPAKDVDGLTAINAGRLAAGRPALTLDRPDGGTLAPCTPLGVMRLLAMVRPSLAGARAVVLGRSALVGRPLAAMLTTADATVTLVHSRSVDVPQECRGADILVAAIGRPNFVRGDWIKPGAIVIDVGINRVDTGLVGDVAYAECALLASALTPVPGGVGPMTVACLVENTVVAALARRSSSNMEAAVIPT